MDTMLPKLKLMIGISEIDTSQDALITLIVEDVINYLVTTTKRVDTELPDALVRRIAVIRYNMMGSEGVQTESYSGVSQTFVSGLPDDIKKEINALRKVTF